MSVDVREDGRRSVQVEVEVPGSPEEVWEAIATGPGISSWFVPTQVEERVGGKIVALFGPGMESESTVTQWNPPQKFSAEGSGMSPDAPPMATEWIVEARSGGTCAVRVVHSWFANSDEWDGQFESVEQGWKAFFNILRLKLEQFPGQPGAAFELAGVYDGGESEAWAALVAPLGLETAAVGSEVRSPEGVPAIAGHVALSWPDYAGEKHLMVLTSEPGTGICHLFAMPMGGQAYVAVRFFLFGSSAAAAVAEGQEPWAKWFKNQFPM